MEPARASQALPGCTLPPPALAARLGALRRELAGARVRDGGEAGVLRFRFADSQERVEDLVGLVRLERACCRALAFALEWDPEGGPVTLVIRGQDPLLAAFRDAGG